MPTPVDNLFAAAFAASPFATERVTIHAEDTGADAIARTGATVEVRGASVQDAGAPQFMEGADPAPWQFVVRFPVAAWTASVPLTAGAWIDGAADRPALHVVQVQRLFGLYHLKCSTREGA